MNCGLKSARKYKTVLFIKNLKLKNTKHNNTLIYNEDNNNKLNVILDS